MRRPSDEVCAGSLHGVIDGVAYGTRNMARVARKALVVVGIAAPVDEPHQADDAKRANEKAREETGGKGLAIKVDGGLGNRSSRAAGGLGRGDQAG